jgi:uncharacterized protein (TIGR01619 family)
MTDNWKSYFCTVNESPASILVNLGLRDHAPVIAKPWLLWVWIYLRFPRADGLSDSREAPTLFKMEDALTLQLSRCCDAILSGKITTQCRREFYFYGGTQEGFHDAVASALAEFEGYRFDVGKQEDSLWEQYLNVLYPSPEDSERIKNRDVLDVLENQGDVSTVTREVRHWIYFASEESRALFREAVVQAGFRNVSESHTTGDLSFEIVVARSQPVDQKCIDETTIELVRLAQRFDGDYDGWETQVITQ